MVYHATVAKGGKVVVPAAVRRQLGLKPGGTLTFAESDGRFAVTTPEIALRELKAYFAKLKRPDVSEVDAFLAERRREAALDDERMDQDARDFAGS